MYDQPNAAELIAIARDTFSTSLLNQLPPESRYAGLMLANALSIAARELEAGEGPERSEYQRLQALDRASPTASQGAGLRAQLPRLNIDLAHDIRAGQCDAAIVDSAQRVNPLYQHLWATTLEKLRVSNPRYLKLHGLT